MTTNLRVRTVPRLRGLNPGICLTTEEKARKNLSQGSQRMLFPITNTPTQLQYPPTHTLIITESPNHPYSTKTHIYAHPHITNIQNHHIYIFNVMLSEIYYEQFLTVLLCVIAYLCKLYHWKYSKWSEKCKSDGLEPRWLFEPLSQSQSFATNKLWRSLAQQLYSSRDMDLWRR